ncbi:MAG: site-specific DNA-methyltransferase [Sulfurovum sp.]
MRQKEDVIEEKSINDINYELLKKQFPNAITIDEDGKYSIDTSKLQMSLDPSLANIREDGYGLNWVGKKEAYHKAFAKNYKVLKPLNDDNSKNWDSTDNILIKGDNLDALKILRHNYFESIKMIYIDPPYNTKNDGFVYNDNFTATTEQTLQELGYDLEYVEYIENIQGAKSHSGWLSFMYPRLLLARDLLKDDGVIFISIDDNEVAQLRLLCDEIFGEGNFVANVIWKHTQQSKNDEKYFSRQYNSLLIYSKSNVAEKMRFPRSEKDNKNYSNPDNDINGDWRSGDIRSPSYRATLCFEIKTPSGKSITFPENGWRWSKEEINKKISSGEIIFNKEETKIIRKIYLKNQDGRTPENIWDGDEFGTTRSANAEIKDLFQDLTLFDTPKPTKLIKKIAQLFKDDKSFICMDFFAGSGTTAHAVMDLNAQDNGSRKFICVQWGEKTPEKSEAKKAGYDTIFDITQERIKRAGEKIVKGDITLQDLDIGFRTFEIVEDTKQKIYQKSLEEMSQDDLLAFTQNSIESNEDILYNLLVAENLPLNSKIETLIEDKLYMSENIAFVLSNISIDALIEKLKPKKALEYITIYSPNISDDKFTLELESAVSSIGIKSDKLRFRG